MSKVSHIISALGGKEVLEKALHQNMSWLIKSFKVNDNLGSSGTRSIRGKWGPSYPETTGYLLPTLLAYAKYFDDPETKALALHQIDFFKSIQNEDGSFWQSLDNKEPIVFDTAQILLGLLSVVTEIPEPEDLLSRIKLAVDWLGKQLDEAGNFTGFNYVEDYNPAYYARIAWAMASAELIKYSKPRTKTKQLITRITALHLENDAFDNMGFYADQPAYTHTIAYTLRGLWECGEILNDRKLKKKVRGSLTTLNEMIFADQKIAGSYSSGWDADESFICSTGNAQLALLNLIMFDRSGHKDYLKTVQLSLAPLLDNQKKHLINAGAIPSSIPMNGPYQRLKYTNWTQKFFCDAILKLLSLSV